MYESAYGFIKLTNIDCKALDKPFADFQNCRLRVPKRGVIALWLHVKLFQIPVNNVSHDIIITNLILQDEMFNRIPVPAGEYMFKLMVGAYNEWKADVKAYFSIRLNKRER
ncbi:unnamed protein product [Ceratitis capitata]|uniref:(Mediterranean fruit fly) hypothetical protein n=1 Tax=Ceratitis capitata TaxID=7213 RepID=A0A811V9X9_CERCA|nr:unnamed protein product [Ceratitis capitata]